MPLATVAAVRPELDPILAADNAYLFHLQQLYPSKHDVHPQQPTHSLLPEITSPTALPPVMDTVRNGAGAGGDLNATSQARSPSPDVPSVEILLQNVIAERNALRLQNDQLWKIIEKQRLIIAQLQQAAHAPPAPPVSSQSTPASAIDLGATLPPPEPGTVSRKPSARRNRASSERPPSSSHEPDMLIRAKLQLEHSEGSTPTTRRRSLSDPHNASNVLTLPAILQNGVPRSTGSATKRDRDRITPTLPPVTGSIGSMGNMSGLQRKPSNSNSAVRSPLAAGSNGSWHGSQDDGSGSRAASARERERSRRSQYLPSAEDGGEVGNENGKGALKPHAPNDSRTRQRSHSGRQQRTRRNSEESSQHNETLGVDSLEFFGKENGVESRAKRENGHGKPMQQKVQQPESNKAAIGAELSEQGGPSSFGMPTIRVDGSIDEPSTSEAPEGITQKEKPNLLVAQGSTGASALSLTMSGDSLGKRGENEGRASKCDERKFLESPADIRIAVTGSQLKLNEKGREVLSFTLTIRNPTNEDLWKIEKAYADFLQLDTKLKSSTTKAVSSKIGKLPDKALFTTHSPTKNDQRKVQLELYTQNVLELCRHSPEMIAFLSTNVLDAAKQSAGETGANVSGTIKEGYLFKKGKNFGAWKSRFFVLRSGGAFEYFESQKDRTSLLGGIKLKYVFVSRQSGTAPLDGLPTSDDGTDTQSGNDTDYRHAFMLTEYKKSCFAPEAKEKGGEQFSESRVISRHILCAENDEERDEWVRLIAREIKLVRPDTTRNGRKPVDERGEVAEPSQQQQPGPTIEDRAQPIDIKMAPGRDARVQDIQQEDPFSAPSQPSTGFGQSPDEAPVQSETPEEHPVAPRRTASIAIMSTSNEALSLAHAMGGGRAGTTSSSSPSKGRTRNFVDDNERVMMQAEPPPLLSPEESRERGQSAAVNIPQAGSKATDKKSKRITTFNWGKKSKDQLSSSNSRSQTLNDRGRRVFGVPLDQAVAISRVREDLQLPAVLYRCIEYLDAKNANEEEGIYRLSGSSSVIQGLKAAFDAEGDVDLLGSQQFYDVHAVAGLLKLYLRELPSPVLTKELQRSFLHVMDLADREERIFELARLVALLPIPNYTLLKILMAHLVRVVRRADINKMNIRNVGIVFSPTVGVPAGVFTLMMAEYASVFWWDGREETRNERIFNTEPTEPMEVEAQHQQHHGGAEEQPTSPTPTSPPASILSEPIPVEDTSDLPQPKRRQPNSAKRRQRQNAMMAGQALMNGSNNPGGDEPTHNNPNNNNIYAIPTQPVLIDAGGPDSINSTSAPQQPGGGSYHSTTRHSRTRPLSTGSKRGREGSAKQSQSYPNETTDLSTQFHRTSASLPPDQASINEVFVDGEEEVEADDEVGDEEEDDGDHGEEEEMDVDGDGSRGHPSRARTYDAYFGEGGELFR